MLLSVDSTKKWAEYIVYFAKSAANKKKLILLQLQLQKYKHLPKQKYKNIHTSTEI